MWKLEFIFNLIIKVILPVTTTRTPNSIKPEKKKRKTVYKNKYLTQAAFKRVIANRIFKFEGKNNTAEYESIFIFR